MFAVLCDAVQIYLLLLFVRVLLGWFPVHERSSLGQANRVLRVITEPVLAPLRQVLPSARFGDVGIDVGPMLGILAASLVARALSTVVG